MINVALYIISGDSLPLLFEEGAGTLDIFMAFGILVVKGGFFQFAPFLSLDIPPPLHIICGPAN